jgi:hypothetical protein
MKRAEFKVKIRNKDNKQIEYKPVTGSVFKFQIIPANKPLVFYIGVYHPIDKYTGKVNYRQYYIVDLKTGLSFTPVVIKKTKKEAINTVLNNLIYKLDVLFIYYDLIENHYEPAGNDDVIKKLDDSKEFYRLI